MAAADAEADAHRALTEEGHAGRAHITGLEALSPAERPASSAKAIGREVRFEQITEDQERERRQSYGYPEDHVQFGIQLAADPPTRPP